jgi:hypothetical protein
MNLEWRQYAEQAVNNKQGAVSCLLLAGFCFDPEDRGNMFIWL